MAEKNIKLGSSTSETITSSSSAHTHRHQSGAAPCRCAIYTRKSHEEGLDQSFNSLDAQRVSAENYIASQIHENWRVIQKNYDDGGFSGGNMNRPALRELFDDIRANLIDMVVVYKIDRLSRSLLDFSKIVELFDKHNVGFVSVTQAFNTSTSSGKLMLNMLLSFAQYERELTGERIRDKFASSLKKGMWMGGCLPLGYECKDRKLVINEDEGKIIKFIYEKFAETESYHQVCGMLNKDGYRTKVKVLKTGECIGGQMFEPKAVFRILRNPYYKGCVTHKGSVYQGEHEAIIDEETWGKAQEIFVNHSSTDTNAGKTKHTPSSPALLSGLIKCASCGCLMGAGSAKKGNLTYRYYTCYNHKKYKNCKAEYKSVPADIFERNVADEVLRVLKSPEVVMQINKLAEEREWQQGAVKAEAEPRIEKEELFNAIKNLRESWEYLYQAEKRKILKLIVNSVNVLDDGIKINLNLEGFDGFLLELAV